VSHFIMTDVRLFAGGADLTASTNKVEVAASVEDKDSTTFASGGWKEVLGGLASTTLNAEGLWEANDPSLVDDNRWAALGGASDWSVCPQLANVGSLAYFTKAMDASYQLGGAVGDIAPYQAKAMGTWPLVRGQIAHPPGTARTATGTGTGVQLGAVAAGQQLYAALHVLSVAGTVTPTITVAVESDADNSFASPVTALTFGAATAPGGQIIRAAGPNTDPWFRAKWTISGTTPSFLFVVALGVK
jgi:hypothetical protein